MKIYLSVSLLLTSVAVYLMVTSFLSDKWVTEEVTANLKGVANVLIGPIMSHMFNKPLPENPDHKALEQFTVTYPEISERLGLGTIDPALDIDIKRSYSLHSHRSGIIVDISINWVNTSFNPFSSLHLKEKLKQKSNFPDIRAEKFAFTERLIIVSMSFAIAACVLSLLTSTTIELKKTVKKTLLTAIVFSCLIAGGFAFAALTRCVRDSNFAEDFKKEEESLKALGKSPVTHTLLEFQHLRHLKNITYGYPVIAVVIAILLLSINALISVYNLIKIKCEDLKIEKVEDYEKFDSGDKK